MKKERIIIGIILFLLWQPGQPPHATAADLDQAQAARALRMCLENVGRPIPPHSQLMNAVIRFYQDRQFQPAWMSSEGLTPQGSVLLDALKSSSDQCAPGLNAYIRHLELMLQDGRRMQSFSTTFPLDALLKVEVGITESALSFVVRNSTDGLLPDEDPVGPEDFPWTAGLTEDLEESTWNALLGATTPRQKPFLALKKALERFNTIQLLGGWPTIPPGHRMRPGRRDPRVPLLRRRLIISGDMGLETLGSDNLYDDALAAGVRRFQQRHGLSIDGVAGPDTLAELNTSVQERITQIKLNMLRWRRLPERLGQRYLLANIPGFKLDVVENHRVVRSMRTIVGKPGRRTPMMSVMMTYLEINPYWNIPQQIASTDILPKIHVDPRFLLHNDIQVFNSWREDASALNPMTIDWKCYSKAYFPFRLRQKPSASNALGRIKFMFPNQFSVYIHDTPARSLFNKTNRGFSSGCIRIEDPLALAGYLLADQGWNKDKIEAKVKHRKRTVVVLKEPIPVHLVYLTAWAKEEGTVQFYHDLYGCDQRLREELNRPPIQPVGASDLMALDRIIEKRNDSAQAGPSGANDAAAAL